MANKKTFKQAPLPFIGQKRMFLKHVEIVLNKHIDGEGDGWTIVDVFGGSGLLSHTAKRLKPKATVIYNDFDGYAERLKHIDDINRLRQIIFNYLHGIIPKNGRLSKEIKAEIINKINDFKGYKDLNCLASWLLFSGQQVGSIEALFAKDFWHCVRQSDYPTAEGYLDGIEVISESFHKLIPRYQNQEKVLLLLDPPYLCTRQESYKQGTYFDLIDFLRLINLTKPPYIFFSSTKSEFIRYLDYMQESKTDNWESFEGYERIVVKASASKDGIYEDNMIYKF
ncbi:DNA adenine methylase [Haemophilus parainfluenzae]|uniref:DNA adenine methylase n=1 Tax=Haemophilus parainfluenzae TaxID=729 RepID=UPI002E31E992|nr:DNA adenine methylase [Haemophilus parainfluenzae]